MAEQLPKLTARHSTFVEEYLKDFDATRAAKDSGYSAKTAKQQGYQILNRPDVQLHIQERLKQQHTEKILDADKIIKMLSEMAQVDPMDFYDERGNMKNLSAMPKAARQCISEIRQGQFGPVLKLEGRIKAIELVGKHLKLWSDAISVNFGSDDKEIIVNVNFGSGK